MGNSLISASHYKGSAVGFDGVTNTKTPTGLNQKQMEGLTASFVGDSKVMYGGNDDNDDSGSISYLSLRYGGKVIGLANELNGLSLGGIGRETDINHIEIMNNVDDGIEIWGGTVCLKYVNIWNIGDDSFDIDEGWRGKAQFGLIVQGYSANMIVDKNGDTVAASQGSGIGDNCFETDGAEDSDAEPVTTAAIYNFTVVGQYDAGDGGTVWRDNARVQYRNCIFMDLGEELVRFDGDDGDGASGYGHNGTLDWASTWTTPATYSTTTAVVGSYDGVSGTETWAYAPGAFNDPAVMYQSQDPTGMLAEIKDSVFFANAEDNDDKAAEVGVFDASNNNVNSPYDDNDPEAGMPIQKLVRGDEVTVAGKTMHPVIFINPCAANDAVTSVDAAPKDGFFVPAQYRGGFSASNNWLAGWTAVAAYGMTDVSMNSASADINADGIVDFSDLAAVAGSWLEVK